MTYKKIFNLTFYLVITVQLFNITELLASDYHKNVNDHLSRSYVQFKKEEILVAENESTEEEFEFSDEELNDDFSEESDDFFEDEFGEDFGFENEFAEEKQEEVFDPLHYYNRFMTQVNDKIYFWAVKPAAIGYKSVVPETARQGVNNFFKNLLFPLRFINNVLQLKFKNAGEEALRFGLNTTVGILGFRDPAKDWYDLKEHPEDFGQTLGYYGVGSGFHIVLPVLGPSNLRDAIGLYPEYLVDPISRIEDYRVELGVRAYDIVNKASLHPGEYENLKKDAIDWYPFLRDVYEQNREKNIKE